MKRPAEIRGVDENLYTPARVVRGKTVAIVGNGPSALGKGWGRAIDDHDVVIRINAGAPADGQSRQLGIRTTVLAVATQRCLAASMTHMRASPQGIWWMKRTRLGWGELGKIMKTDLSDAVWVWPELWEKECHEFVGAPPSTGVRMAWAARQHLKASMISLIGFDCWEDGESWWYTQRPGAVIQHKNRHDGLKERGALTKLGYRDDAKGWLVWAG